MFIDMLDERISTIEQEQQTVLEGQRKQEEEQKKHQALVQELQQF